MVVLGRIISKYENNKIFLISVDQLIELKKKNQIDNLNRYCFMLFEILYLSKRQRTA